jgi:hypothetical protein
VLSIFSLAFFTFLLICSSFFSLFAIFSIFYFPFLHILCLCFKLSN